MTATRPDDPPVHEATEQPNDVWLDWVYDEYFRDPSDAPTIADTHVLWERRRRYHTFDEPYRTPLVRRARRRDPAA